MSECVVKLCILLFVRQSDTSHWHFVVVNASIGWMYFGSLNRLCADVPCVKATVSKISFCSRISSLTAVFSLAILYCQSFPRFPIATKLLSSQQQQTYMPRQSKNRLLTWPTYPKNSYIKVSFLHLSSIN
jgi:hypothetical protein